MPVPALVAGTPEAAPHRAAARERWARLLARIDAVFPLTGPFGHAAMRSIAFLTAPSTVRQRLEHRGEPTRPPRGAPARGPPRWAAVAAALPAGNAPRWEQAAQPRPEIDCDQRLTWCSVPAGSGAVPLRLRRAAAPVLGAAAIKAGHGRPVRRPRAGFSGARRWRRTIDTRSAPASTRRYLE